MVIFQSDGRQLPQYDVLLLCHISGKQVRVEARKQSKHKSFNSLLIFAAARCTETITNIAFN
jgi:hypothetical protein